VSAVVTLIFQSSAGQARHIEITNATTAQTKPIKCVGTLCELRHAVCAIYGFGIAINIAAAHSHYWLRAKLGAGGHIAYKNLGDRPHLRGARFHPARQVVSLRHDAFRISARAYRGGEVSAQQIIGKTGRQRWLPNAAYLSHPNRNPIGPARMIEPNPYTNELLSDVH
jgi:hypothetical protein